MGDMIDRDATLAAAQKAFGRVLTGSEKLLLDNVLEAIRAVPNCAASSEDVRAGALKEAEKALRDWQDSLNVQRLPNTAVTIGMAADVVAALIPEVK